MMTHTGFVLASYGVSIVVLVALVGWILIDQQAQRRALQELETRGVRRRSEARTDSAS
ncbi:MULTISPECIES: heme exporter protein CcmD [unclassified Phyllobacterium]|uniref:heme exporter protein CcmD n=1 Tax=Phyllobacterium TaxID=28100 RepID=UPI000DDA33B7|nr:MULTISPECIES: heme exporter protein CcmD [unclassified Phyllobacterium]MBA8899860.1 heme exporter protein D [Phyllobacterium sp. P30BS-XVII]UGX85835.1 heme exporter protein CcmD [Phyllobacterium sp. T1293]